MKWERWSDPKVVQIYEVEGCEGDKLECLKGDEVSYFEFEANDEETLAVFKAARYVRVAAPGAQPTPVRPVEGGWEEWTGSVGAVHENA